MEVNASSAQNQQIIRMRHLVGFLGEKSQFGWWPTAFYGSSSRLFLEPIFSKTSTLAQHYGVVEAARRFHDEHLSVGSYHLFRLPEEIEQDLHEMVQTKSGDLFDNELTVSTETALGALGISAISGNEHHVGPVLVGPVEDLRTAAVWMKISKIYWIALSSGTQAFPYLVS
jgi:hypothetical protein